MKFLPRARNCVGMDQSSTSQNRRSRRSPVLLAATVDVAGVAEPVKLRNLSEEGALVQGERLPLEGSMTHFQRNDLRVKGRVVWVHGTFAGIAFTSPLNREQVLRNVPKAKPLHVQEFRRPGLACRPLSDDERRLVEKWMTSSPVARPGE
jgi:hypothetical protein